MAVSEDDVRRSLPFLDDINARLAWAEKTGATIEVVFAVRGRVSPVPGRRGERWRLRSPRGHIVSFRPEFVIAFNGTIDLPDGAPPPRRWGALPGNR